MSPLRGLSTTLLTVTLFVTAALSVPAGRPAAGAAPAASLRPVPADEDLASPAVPGRLLVQLEPGTPPAAVDAIATAADADAAAPIGAGASAVVEVEPARAGQVAADLAADPRVRAVEPDYVVETSTGTNDPIFVAGDLYGLGAGTGGIGATGAWTTTVGDDEIVVGVLDTGIYAGHPDLGANLWRNRTGVGGCPYDSNGYDAVSGDCAPGDSHYHGTHVAGTIGAVGNNGIGVTGVNQRVRLMALRMLNAAGQGSTSDAVEAIDWAVAAKQAGVNLRVLNASWGGAGESVNLRAAIERARSAGILFVAAAGNDGENVEVFGEYPCASNLDNVVCVAATDQNDTRAWFSNYGATSVDLYAPGVAIWSTMPPDWGVGGYGGLDGTSMAAPHVAGAAALVLAARPGLTLAELRAAVLGAVDPLPAPTGPLVATGGRLDVCRAVPGCEAGAVGPTPPRHAVVRQASTALSASWSPPASNGDGVGVTGYTVTASNGYTQSVGAGVTSVVIPVSTLNVNLNVTLRADNASATGIPAALVARPTGGGFEVDAWGALHPVGGTGLSPPSPAAGGPSWPGQDVARGVAMLPSGTGGYVVDRFGGLHPFAVGANAPPPAATGGPYWPGLDIVRGATLLPDGRGGYVVDAYGGLHPFAVGDRPRPAAATGGPYWFGWDVVRGATMRDGEGGFVLDAYGALHPFAVGAAPRPAHPTSGPYWPWPIARGASSFPGFGGGYVVDGWGGLHRYASGGATPPAVGSSPYWRGWDVVRGVGL